MLFNKYERNKTPKTWENFRRQRNLVTSLRRRSLNKYFIDRCTGGCKSETFWSTVKTFVTNKGNKITKDTVLHENESIKTDQKEICNIFNNFFVNVAKNIGESSSQSLENHPSINAINSKKADCPDFKFHSVEFSDVSKEIDKLNSKKATGMDGIPPKIVKISKNTITNYLTSMINLSFQTATFPDNLKIAQVTPLHKKNSTLDKTNYRPVSILSVMSKIFERAINSQLSAYFNLHFNPFLSAFRSGYGCQTTLLCIVEDWKQALDKNYYLAAVLMDLSKAFDCLPHDLLIVKLKHYGVTDSSLNLISSYLTNRKQCVKLGHFKSDFESIYKGVPQGSILGPVLFNIFINDIFYFTEKSNLYNYADDNTISYASDDPNEVKSVLEKESLVLIKWFTDNQMQANPEKFQAIAMGQKSKKHEFSFSLPGANIKCEEEVKLLGVTIDFQLNFKSHVSIICKKASRQLNVLKRIGKYLCKLGKLNIYHSFIMSNFNFCPLTWHFCGETNTRKIENIQKRALRFIYDDYSSSYETLLLKSKLPTLKVRRLRSMALETFKIIHKQTPSYLHDLIKIKESSYSFRYTNRADVPQVRTMGYGLNSFRSAAPRLWNSLPQHYREVTGLSQFQGLIGAWDGESCRCSCCSN